jgi:lipoprotein-anchoring transpeptidase ErfK/SrfK
VAFRRPSSAEAGTVVIAAVAGIAVAVALSSGSGGGSAASQQRGAATTVPPPGPRTLSRPGHLSRWAFVVHPVKVRARPNASAPVVGRLGTSTGDGTDEIVFALQRERDQSSAPWIRVRTPLLPTGTTGWVPRSALTAYGHVRTWLVVDRKLLRAALVRNGRVVFRAPVGIGKKGSETPAGRFYIRNRLLDLPGGTYGPAAFGTSARSTKVTDWPGEKIVGIHGTNRPEILPGRVSHGCVRMRNEDILRLVRLMPVGTPVTVY